jgi:hypothetical protein
MKTNISMRKCCTERYGGGYDDAAGSYIFRPRTGAGSTVNITYTDETGKEATLSFTITDAATPLGDGAKEDSGFPWWIIAAAAVVIAALLWWTSSRRKREKDKEENAA